MCALNKKSGECDLFIAKFICDIDFMQISLAEIYIFFHVTYLRIVSNCFLSSRIIPN